MRKEIEETGKVFECGKRRIGGAGASPSGHTIARVVNYYDGNEAAKPMGVARAGHSFCRIRPSGKGRCCTNCRSSVRRVDGFTKKVRRQLAAQ